jgi:hypothetical protein
LKTVFSFHPTRELPNEPDYPILVGKCEGFPAFMVQCFKLSEEALPDSDDAISIKKCVVSISQAHNTSLKAFADKKFQTSSLKKLSVFLSKVMSTYPFAH